MHQPVDMPDFDSTEFVAPAHIRGGVVADAPRLSRHMAQWWLAAYSHSSSATNVAAFVSSSYNPQRQAAELADPSIHTLIAQCGDDWLGYVQLRYASVPPACVDPVGAGELGRFFLAPEQRGSGLAAVLMQRARAEAAARGRASLWLLAWEEAPWALRFYAKHGFEKVGTADFFVGGEPKCDWVMQARI